MRVRVGQASCVYVCVCVTCHAGFTVSVCPPCIVRYTQDRCPPSLSSKTTQVSGALHVTHTHARTHTALNHHWQPGQGRRQHGSPAFRPSRVLDLSASVCMCVCVYESTAHVFGSYTPEGWRIAPRYYGSGESFVFQLEVRMCVLL